MYWNHGFSTDMYIVFKNNVHHTPTAYVGRNDTRKTSKNDANSNLPPPFFNLSQLLCSYQSHGLDLHDLVVLSKSHSIGLARWVTFCYRIYNETDIYTNFATSLSSCCPRSGGDDVRKPFDSTTTSFDTKYFVDLVNKMGNMMSLIGNGEIRMNCRVVNPS
jgi:peroxidase